jgi:hypothetical protein
MERKKNEKVTDFNTKANTTFPGFKEKKLENCTKIDDVPAYKEKYKQKPKNEK